MRGNANSPRWWSDIVKTEVKVKDAPMDIVNIPLFTGFHNVQGGAGFLPSTVFAGFIMFAFVKIDHVPMNEWTYAVYSIVKKIPFLVLLQTMLLHRFTDAGVYEQNCWIHATTRHVTQPRNTHPTVSHPFCCVVWLGRAHALLTWNCSGWTQIISCERNVIFQPFSEAFAVGFEGV